MPTTAEDPAGTMGGTEEPESSGSLLLLDHSWILLTPAYAGPGQWVDPPNAVGGFQSGCGLGLIGGSQVPKTKMLFIANDLQLPGTESKGRLWNPTHITHFEISNTVNKGEAFHFMSFKAHILGLET